MKYFTKSLITEKLPSSLSWLENSTIQYKFRNSYSNWTSQLNLRLKTDYLQLYSVDEPSDRNVLILTSPLEKIDLKVLISNCVQLKICPWVLVSEALVMSTDDFEIAVKKIGKN